MTARTTDCPGWRLALRQLAQGLVPIIWDGELLCLSFPPRRLDKPVRYYRPSATNAVAQTNIDVLAAFLTAQAARDDT